MGRLHRLPLRFRRLLSRLLVASRGVPGVLDMERPGDALFAARVKVGMSQAEAGRRAGMTQPHWHALEAGKTDASLTTWRRAFDALDIDLIVIPKARRTLGDWRDERAKEGRWSARSVRRIADD